jgi:hypothetical protein
MSTYAIYGEIIFPASRDRGKITIRRFSSIKIESGFRSLCDTAVITLPRMVRDFDRNKVLEVFKEGDPVIIQYGYDGNLNVEFTGYITKINVGIPVIISCEDEMYNLKRKKISVSKTDCTLSQLLQTIAPGYTISCDDALLVGSIRYSNKPISEILDSLREQNIFIWFEDKTLHAYSVSRSAVDPVSITLERTAGEPDLSQKAIEDVYVIVKCLVLNKKRAHRYISAKYGEESAGCKIEKSISGMTLTEADLLKEAKLIYNQKKAPGLEGDINLFGVPRVQHGMRISLKSLLYPEKDGTYYIDAVTKTVGKEGIRQKCKLGSKAA